MNPLALAVEHPRSAAVFGALAIAMSGVFYLMSGVSPSTGVFWRCVYGLPILLIVAWREWGTIGPMSRRAVGLCTAAGLCFAVDLITFHYAVDVIGAGLATVMGNLQVVIVALAAWAVFGERPTERGAGSPAGHDAGRRPDLGRGRGRSLWRQSAARRGHRRAHGDRVCRVPADHPARDAGPAPGGAGGDRDRGHRAVRRAVRRGRGRPRPDPRACLADAYLIALGVLSQSVGYLAIQVSLPRLPAVIASVLLLVQPVTTVFLGAFLLRELPSPFQLVGVALVIGGIALATGLRSPGSGRRSAPGRGAR